MLLAIEANLVSSTRGVSGETAISWITVVRQLHDLYKRFWKLLHGILRYQSIVTLLSRSNTFHLSSKCTKIHKRVVINNSLLLLIYFS